MNPSLATQYVKKGRRIGLALALMLPMLLLAFTTTLPAQAADTGSLTVETPNITYGQRLTISGSGFGVNETIGIWVTPPTADGTPILDFAQVFADGHGSFSKFQPVTYIRSVVPPGIYHITVQGISSKITAVATFTLMAPTLQIYATKDSSGTVALTLKGANYFPGETISLWVTDATGRVASLGNVYATLDGNMPASPDDTAIWKITGVTSPLAVSAHGNTSQQTIITKFNPAST